MTLLAVAIAGKAGTICSEDYANGASLRKAFDNCLRTSGRSLNHSSVASTVQPGFTLDKEL